jgi:CRISPR-associated endonuclease Csn1
MPIASNGFVLGVDLGVKSVGLALIDPESQRIIHTAVRVFPAGVAGTETDFASGRDESKNKKRREARLARRQTERRARRMHSVFRLLQRQRLLPEGEAAECLKELDRKLAAKYPPHPGVPYTLRAKALDSPLEEHELGRALYHLAQRRGFLSNRRAPVKDDEKDGAVLGGIKGLSGDIQEAGARTLGEYFAKVDPHAKRIRMRYTHRKMYQEEFDALWAAQALHHPEILTPEFRESLRKAMFHQRPLKDQSDKIGACSLMPEHKRAALCELDTQRWRLLDKVNNLRLEDPAAKLTSEARESLLRELTVRESLTYPQVRKLLDLPKSSRFTIEDQGRGEKKILGNVTSAKFSQALNLRWDQMPRPEQDALVALWASADDDEQFRSALGAAGGYSSEEIERLLNLRLSDARVGFSLPAIRRLLPHMEAGATTGEARKAEFPESFVAAEPKDSLPPVLEALPELRNPAVTRTLTELRKAVNELIRRFGKPAEIRVELARDLKRNKKDRQSLTKLNRENEDRRDEASAKLKSYDPNPSRRTIEKYLLWEECGHTCPYSGRSISLQALVDGGEFEVEHIVPYSRSLDDSFQNKTLCVRDYNARKESRTPWEAFGPNSEEWEPMVQRVKDFKNRRKLKIFEMQETDTAELLKQFSTNQLNDTRYMSKLAGKYLGMLYGGVSDAEGNQRIFACAGGVTGLLRRLWNLNRILSETPEKTREDHRHHAVDAATVAMVTQGMVQRLAQASAAAESSGQRRLKSFEDPWDGGFREQLDRQIKERTVVSHRPERKLAGALHEETLYGRPHQANGKQMAHIRKPVHELSGNKEIESIVDQTVRDRVKLQLKILGGEIKKLEHELPTLETRDGRRIPIRRVRVRIAKSTEPIGKGASLRHVVTGDNHHMAVFAVQKKGKTAYVADVVSRLEAVRRNSAKPPQPVVQKGRPDAEFLFSLSEGDMVKWKDELWRVRLVTGQEVGLSRATDARLKAEIIKAHQLERKSVNELCKTGARKVTASPLGEIRESHD